MLELQLKIYLIYIYYFIRSVTDYCAVVFHSSLNKQQTKIIEQIQKTCLKIILGDMYMDYDTSLEICGLKSLEARRQDRMLNFSLKAIKHPQNKRIFPMNETHQHNMREREPFKVNFANTENYRTSAVPSCQRTLNTYFSRKYKWKTHIL